MHSILSNVRRTRGALVLGLAVATAALAACYVGPVENDAQPTTAVAPTEGDVDPDGVADDTRIGEGVGPDGVGEHGEVPAAKNGLPCDVDAVLQAKCRTCHGANPRSPMSLLTFEDLVAPAKSDPTKSVAVLSHERMQDDDKPMPPNKDRKATAPELDAFAKWIAAGLPAGTCAVAAPDADAGGSGGSSGSSGASGSSGNSGSSGTSGGAADAGPDASTKVCTSGVYWTGTERSARMNPGRACIGCHQNAAQRPILQIAGTVYPTLAEADKCYGVQVPAYVVVTDATGRSVTLPTGATGNFTLSTNVAPLVYPIKVKVVRNGQAREMASSPPHGDCNACHTETGKNGAPGRILPP